jgi:DNA-binding winged helix-turn-helix (wHTH) protein
MAAARVAFGECVYDGGARTLAVGGEARHLSPRAFELLGALLEARPRALSKKELNQLLWPETHVSSTSLAQLVTELRKTIGDDPRESRWIRTVFGFGYAFAGEATEAPDAGRRDRDAREAGGPGWWLVWADREIPLRNGETLIGRSADVLVRIRSGDVSRHHARVTVGPDGAAVEDLGSRNGTFVNGEKIEGPRSLKEGDLIGVGAVQLVFCGTGSEASTWSGRPVRA